MPLTLLELEGTHEAAVVEMGMNAFGEIDRLTRISCPTIGVLTNVYPAHTEGVGISPGWPGPKGTLRLWTTAPSCFTMPTTPGWPAWPRISGVPS